MALDEESVRTHWPGLTRFQPIGNRLFLVAGAAPMPAKVQSPQGPAGISGTEELGCPVALAEQLLEAARQSGDRSKEAAALIDLGIVTMNEGDLEEGRRSPGKGRGAQSPARGQGTGDRCAQQPRIRASGHGSSGNGAASARRRRCNWFARSATRMPRSSLWNGWEWPMRTCATRPWPCTLLNKALEMTRAAGDRQQETRVLWNQAITYADLNQRDQAIARAQESIDLLRKLGKPEASWYGAQLQRYRMDFAGLAGNGPGMFGATVMTGGPMGGSVMTATQTGTDPSSGPGLLRMAVSATKAMMKFIGSGLKTTAPDIQQNRLATCQACEHHTGLRCRICGCFTNVKTRMAHEQCPIGKWPA